MIAKTLDAKSSIFNKKIFYESSKILAKDSENSHKRSNLYDIYIYIIHTLILFLSVFHEVFSTNLTKSIRNTIFVFNLNIIVFETKRNIYKTTKNKRIEIIWTTTESLICKRISYIFQTLKSRKLGVRFYIQTFLLWISQSIINSIYSSYISLRLHVILQ